MEVILKVRRKWLTDKSTISEGFFDNSTERELYFLEDRVRSTGVKIQDETAIPAGKYELVLSYSNRFNRITPLLLNVPNFQGIRIHPGNTDKQSSGCLLTGSQKDVDMVLGSRVAYQSLYDRLHRALQAGKVYVEISMDIQSDKRTTDAVGI